jgi:thiamine-phosphate pyrophosphorylase
VNPRLYYITDRNNYPLSLLDNIKRAIDAGVDFVQIREKDLPVRELLSLARIASDLKTGSRTRILINDRLDVALAADLEGIHLAQSSIPASRIRAKLSRPDFLIGVSTHSLEEVRAIQDCGVSFITFGPVFFTPSKSNYGPPVGLEALKDVCHSSRIPVFALGGIDQNNYVQCLISGAEGIAAIRLFQDPNLPIEKVVRKIKEVSDQKPAPSQ